MNTATQIKTSNPQDNELLIKELLYENKVLLEQLNYIQEKIENDYTCFDKEIKSNNIVIIPEQAKNALKENIKLRAQVIQQQIALQIERQNSITSRLGITLIKSVDSIRNILALPFKLYKIWKSIDRTTPPTALGGIGFQKVLDAYNVGQIDAVENLLNSIFISSVMRANAYTALARHLMCSDINQVAKLARMAWETDPRPYRLKWLAFRLHEAGDFINAEAILSMLPSDISLTNSEKKHLERIKQDSNDECNSKIDKIIGISEEEATKQKNIIQNLKHSVENEKIKNNTLNITIHKLHQDHKCELEALNNQIIEKNKIITNKNSEILQMQELLKCQELQLQNLKKSFDTINIHYATMLKNLLNKFEHNPDILSTIIQNILNKRV